MKLVMDDKRYGTSGLMIAAPPPSRKPCLIISVGLTGDHNNACKAFKSLHDLKLVVANVQEVPLQNARYGRAAFEAVGDFKNFIIVSLSSFGMGSNLKVSCCTRQ